MLRQRVEVRPQPRLRIRRGCLIARLHFHLQHQPQVGDEIAVIHLRGPPRLARVIPPFGPLLMSIQRLHRRVDVENPGLFQQRVIAVVQMPAQPTVAGLLGGFAKGPPYGILADHLAHPQKLRVHPIAANRVDVRIAAVASEHAEQQRAQHVALGRRVGTAVVERTILDPILE